MATDGESGSKQVCTSGRPGEDAEAGDHEYGFFATGGKERRRRCPGGSSGQGRLECSAKGPQEREKGEEEEAVDGAGEGEGGRGSVGSDYGRAEAESEGGESCPGWLGKGRDGEEDPAQGEEVVVVEKAGCLDVHPQRGQTPEHTRLGLEGGEDGGREEKKPRSCPNSHGEKGQKKNNPISHMLESLI